MPPSVASVFCLSSLASVSCSGIPTLHRLHLSDSLFLIFFSHYFQLFIIFPRVVRKLSSLSSASLMGFFQYNIGHSFLHWESNMASVFLIFTQSFEISDFSFFMTVNSHFGGEIPSWIFPRKRFQMLLKCSLFPYDKHILMRFSSKGNGKEQQKYLTTQYFEISTTGVSFLAPNINSRVSSMLVLVSDISSGRIWDIRRKFLKNSNEKNWKQTKCTLYKYINVLWDILAVEHDVAISSGFLTWELVCHIWIVLKASLQKLYAAWSYFCKNKTYMLCSENRMKLQQNVDSSIESRVNIWFLFLLIFIHNISFLYYD